MRNFIEKQKQEIKKRKIAIIIILSAILITFLIIVILYKVDGDIKSWIDSKILNKEIKQDDAVYIELENEGMPCCAYSQYIGTLANNNFNIYNTSGEKEETLEIEISNPIFNSSDRFLAIAENGRTAGISNIK